MLEILRVENGFIVCEKTNSSYDQKNHVAKNKNELISIIFKLIKPNKTKKKEPKNDAVRG